MSEDEVIGYVIAALRVVRNPDDAAAMHTFARCVLSEHFLQEVDAALSEHTDFLVSARALADRRPPKDPDTRKLWRLIYQLENLRALPRSHGTLPAVIEEILSQTVGPYRNKLEERHDELTDPAALPEAVELAVRLRSATAISFAPRGGAGIHGCGRGGRPAVPRSLHAVPRLCRQRRSHRPQRHEVRRPRAASSCRRARRCRHAHLLRHIPAGALAVAGQSQAGRHRAPLRHRLWPGPSRARRRDHAGPSVPRAAEAPRGAGAQGAVEQRA